MYIHCLNLSDDDSTIGEVLLCSYLSNLMPFTSEPVWLQVVGPPASHKTESLRPFMDLPYTVAVSSMTPNSLLSGHRDKDDNDPSLILRLDGKNLIIKDMTTVYSMDRTSREKIFGDMRDAFDGMCSKASGVSGLTQYRARFGVQFAVTEIIDSSSDKMQQLGERFLTYRTFRYPPTHDQSIEYVKHVMRVSRSKTSWQELLRSTVAEQIEVIRKHVLNSPPPECPDEYYQKIAEMAHCLSMFRTSPINNTPVSGEMASRVSQQLYNEGSTRCASDLRRIWNEEDLSMCRRIALDTLPSQRRRVLQTLYRSADSTPLPYTSKQLARNARSTESEIRSLMLQYMNTNLVRPVAGYADREIRYELDPKIREILKRTQLFDSGPHLPGQWITNKFKPKG